MSVAVAVAVPAAAGVVSALQFSSASTVYAAGQVIEGTGAMLSVTVMVCTQVVLSWFPQWSVAIAFHVRAIE